MMATLDSKQNDCPATPEDIRVSTAVDRALRATGLPYLRNVDIHVRDGEVILRGKVPSFYVRQVAGETALILDGVHTIRNELEIMPSR